MLGRSIGALPNPAYLPPCEGGRSAERLALAAPRPAKYLSSTLALPPCAGAETDGEDVRPIGVWLREVAEGVAVEEGAGLVPGTYSLPSTLADRRSFHSSPTSPE